MNQRTAFLAIVGRPNVGKSSVMNRLLGQKVAIVSPKPQTTRTRIMGVLTEGDDQFVFIDTPGLHKPRTALGENMVRAVGEGMSDVDGCLLVVEVGKKVSAADEELIARFEKATMPVVLVINKIDLIADKQSLAADIVAYTERYAFTAVVPVSARTGSGFDALKSEISALAVPGRHLFDDDTLTDQPERVIAAELIREKFLRLLDQEIPHGIAVGIEKFADRPERDLLDIDATIYCEKQSHKGIVIGKGGATLKRAASLARQEMESFFGCKVNLQCWVKVKEDWRNRQGLLHNFGLD